MVIVIVELVNVREVLLLCLFYKNNNFSSWNLYVLLFYKAIILVFEILKHEWNAWKYFFEKEDSNKWIIAHFLKIFW